MNSPLQGGSEIRLNPRCPICRLAIQVRPFDMGVAQGLLGIEVLIHLGWRDADMTTGCQACSQAPCSRRG